MYLPTNHVTHKTSPATRGITPTNSNQDIFAILAEFFSELICHLSQAVLMTGSESNLLFYEHTHQLQADEHHWRSKEITTTNFTLLQTSNNGGLQLKLKDNRTSKEYTLAEGRSWNEVSERVSATLDKLPDQLFDNIDNFIPPDFCAILPRNFLIKFTPQFLTRSFANVSENIPAANLVNVLAEVFHKEVDNFRSEKLKGTDTSKKLFGNANYKQASQQNKDLCIIQQIYADFLVQYQKALKAETIQTTNGLDYDILKTDIDTSSSGFRASFCIQYLKNNPLSLLLLIEIFPVDKASSKASDEKAGNYIDACRATAEGFMNKHDALGKQKYDGYNLMLSAISTLKTALNHIMNGQN